MRWMLIFFILFMFPGSPLAAVPPVAEQMRSIELERQAQDRGHSVGLGRSIYFDKVNMAMPVDDRTRIEIEKLADRYKKRFLSPKRADRLCQQAKELLIKDAQALSFISCTIENSTFSIQFKP